jgi:hypothetical protein
MGEPVYKAVGRARTYSRLLREELAFTSRARQSFARREEGARGILLPEGKGRRGIDVGTEGAHAVVGNTGTTG